MSARQTRSSGFTLIEVLIALAVISIALGALGLVQLTNLRASSSSRVSTETKNAANGVLEQILANVLRTAPCTTADGTWCIVEAGTGTYYAFNDYYWSCPSFQTPPTPVRDRHDTDGTCNGSQTISTGSGDDVSVDFVIEGQAGIEGEGVLAITVTAEHSSAEGRTVTIGDRVTCFDVYPTPTAQAPAPCPVPTQAGSGRTAVATP